MAISTELFAQTDYNSRSIQIYQDAATAPGDPESLYYFTPLFLLVPDDDQKPLVKVDGTTAEVRFQIYTQGLRNQVLEIVKQKTNRDDIQIGQIALVPLTEIKLTTESPSVPTHQVGEAGVELLVSEQYVAKFPFATQSEATTYEKRVRNEQAEDFTAHVVIPSVGIQRYKIDIRARDLKQVSWKNFVNEDNKEENIDAPNQYFTVNQLSESFADILKYIQLTVIQDGDPGFREITVDRKDLMFERFKALLPEVPVDLSEASDIFIDKESFKADVITNEYTKYSNAMTQSINTVVDTFEEKIKEGTWWTTRESALKQLSHEIENKRSEGDLGGNVKWGFGLLDISPDASGSYDYSQNLRSEMEQESSAADFSTFSNETRSKMRSELAQLHEQNSSFEWGFEGVKVIPKRIKLRRVVSSDLDSDFVLVEEDRELSRTITEMAFPIINDLDYVIDPQELPVRPSLSKLITTNMLRVIDKVGIGIANPEVALHVTGDIRVDGKISGNPSNQEWQIPEFLNDWKNYEHGFERAGYFKDILGVVYLRGLIKNDDADSETHIFTLPDGYRPGTTEIFNVRTGLKGAGTIYIAKTGSVTLRDGSRGWVSLSGIIFWAHQ